MEPKSWVKFQCGVENPKKMRFSKKFSYSFANLNLYSALGVSESHPSFQDMEHRTLSKVAVGLSRDKQVLCIAWQCWESWKLATSLSSFFFICLLSATNYDDRLNRRVVTTLPSFLRLQRCLVLGLLLALFP